MPARLSLLPPRVRIVEVGPRDGLQNEPRPIPTAARIGFIDLLAAAGLEVIEVGAFVSPKRVPQMEGTDMVFAGIAALPGVTYTALVPNSAGLRRAIDAGAREVAIFAAASETFSRKNINQSIEEALSNYAEVCRAAEAARVRVRGYLSTCFGCPYEGEVAPDRVAELAERLMELGVYEVSLSDTIGVAHPGQIPDVVGAVARRLPLSAIALHLHDTRGTALANVLAALQLGVSTFDSSAGGLGGCPFAPGAAGNLATEDLLYALNGLGIETGIRLDALVRASSFIEAHVGHPLPSRYYQAERRSSGAT
jgi:hydroxymethylglutaryl-CoA lyase